jgi:ABC-type branched-subunit amino acid transport system ATPase component
MGERRAIEKSFGGVTAFAGVDLRVPRGRTIGIIGPNGAGKTTVLDVISGFLSRPGAPPCTAPVRWSPGPITRRRPAGPDPPRAGVAVTLPDREQWPQIVVAALGAERSRIFAGGGA